MEAAGLPTAAGYPTEGALPEVASVPWRPRASAETLRRRGVHWTVFTTLHVVPFLIVAVVLVLLNPIAVPVAIASLAHAWIIPGLYAQRGANTIKPKRSGRNPSEPVAQGLLADMLGHAERDLERATGLAVEAGAHVTLVTDVNYLLYTPLLPGAAAGTLEPRHVVIPLREELSRTHVMLARLTGADPVRRTVRVASADGRDEEFEYDQLVLALGSVPRTAPVPGLGEHALGFNTLPEAVELRNRAVRR